MINLFFNPIRAVDEFYHLQDVDLLEQMSAWNPHAFLGLHQVQIQGKNYHVIRLWRPSADSVTVQVNGIFYQLKPAHASGLFIYYTDEWIGPYDYKVYHPSGVLAYDPYVFLPVLGDLDLHLLSTGRHYQLHKIMGARLQQLEGVKGVSFAVWAPNAKSVSLVCDSNNWDGRYWPMRSLGQSGVWELFIPGLEEGQVYKFEIHCPDGKRLFKADPFGLYQELRPKTASIVATTQSFCWTDQLWLKRRQLGTDKDGYLPHKHSRPMVIYELHVGSWKKKADSTWLNYRELAHELVHYCHEMGYTHVELMPVMEHPFDGSWGYQVVGFFAISSRWGSINDFQYFVNYLHNHDIGVILDWVPGHFPSDDHGLAQFDGTALFEHQDTRQGFHPHWKTLIFNYGRPEVSNFLLASALYWCQTFHIDGLRVDAVASMLYLDYGREAGEWIANYQGGNENFEAIEFLKHFNSILHKECPGVITIAEESTSFPGVTHSLKQGGLGFDFKWNMGWMNDTLRYFSKDAVWRKWHHQELTFALMYAFTERFTLVLSHDEVVHGKGALISKMPGDYWQKFANVRLLYTYMMCMPGKKLLFMGQDIGQFDEWNHDSCVQWSLLCYPNHEAFKRCIADMNHFYLSHSELWHDDVTPEGFTWVKLDDSNHSTLAYMRHSSAGKLLCVHNFTPSYHPNYELYLPDVFMLKEVFNSDSAKYSGSGKQSAKEIFSNGKGRHAIQLSPLATQIFEAHS